jgi:phospholipase/carboxylesterase
MPLLDCIEVSPTVPALRSVIWLHGLGADGHDFEAIVPELRLPEDLGIRYVFPNAPSIPVTINGGMVMPAWYDILSMNLERELNVDQLLASSQAVHNLIDREIERGVAAENILLAGFSQGGAVNYQAALTYPKPLAGLMALSTYFATAAAITPHAASAGLPIFAAHGSLDPVVPEQLGARSVEDLRKLGFEPIYQTYPMQHQVCGEEIADIARWMMDVFARTAE